VTRRTTGQDEQVEEAPKGEADLQKEPASARCFFYCRGAAEARQDDEAAEKNEVSPVARSLLRFAVRELVPRERGLPVLSCRGRSSSPGRNEERYKRFPPARSRSWRREALPSVTRRSHPGERRPITKLAREKVR